MATALGYDAIERVEGYLEDIQTLVNEWEDHKSAIETTLSSEVGQRFLTEYTIGETATNKITKILDIVIGMQESINSLVSNTYDFCDDQRRANMAGTI